MLAFADGDMDDLAGNVRRDQNLLRADIGIVGRDIAAAGKINAKADHQRNSRKRDQQDHAQALAADPRDRPEPAGASVFASGSVLASGAGTIFNAFSLMT